MKVQTKLLLSILTATMLAGQAPLSAMEDRTPPSDELISSKVKKKKNALKDEANLVIDTTNKLGGNTGNAKEIVKNVNDGADILIDTGSKIEVTLKSDKELHEKVGEIDDALIQGGSKLSDVIMDSTGVETKKKKRVKKVINEIDDNKDKVVNVVKDIKDNIDDEKKSDIEKGTDITKSVLNNGTVVAVDILNKEGKGEIGVIVGETGKGVVDTVEDIKNVINDEKDHEYQTSCAPGLKKFFKGLRIGRKSAKRALNESSKVAKKIDPNSKEAQTLEVVSTIVDVVDPLVDVIVEEMDSGIANVQKKKKKK